MPRPRKQTPPPAANSMVASAARMTRSRVDRPRGKGPMTWQEELWSFLDTVGEFAYANLWISNALSKVRLRVMKTTPAGQVEVTRETAPDGSLDALALDALDALFDGDTGQRQMLHQAGTHMTTPGEFYLVGVPPKVDPNTGREVTGRDDWRVMSNVECHEKIEGSGVWVINRGDGVEEEYDVDPRDGSEPGALIIRIWRPHPRLYVEANSPARAAIPVLREIVGLMKYSGATLDSRLATAGILLMPMEATFASPVDGEAPSDGGPQDADAMMQTLIAVAMAALQDQGTAAAKVPIIAKMPGQYIEAIKHLTLDQPLNAEVQTKLDGCIRRLALAMDMPPEALLGTGDSNHWSAWLSSEEGITLHVDPLAETLVHALTTRYLWLAMAGSTSDPTVVDAIRAYTLDGDTSELRQRPSHSAEAQALHADLQISDAALLRETGFTEADVPKPDEVRTRILRRIALGTITPDVGLAALTQLGIPLTPEPSQVSVAVSERVTTEPTPEDTVPPVADVPAVEAPRNPPAKTEQGPAQQQAAALLAAGELLVMRAVERGWARARGGKVRRPVTTAHLDDALRDAWDTIPRVAALTGVDPARLHDVCDTYARGLLTTGAEHDPQALLALLRDRVLPGRVLEAS